MKLGIITYNKPHLKTQELIFGLKSCGYHDISLIITEFKIRKKREALISHRPQQFIGMSPFQIEKKMKIPSYDIEKKIIKKCDYIIIAGSNLIEKKYIIKNKIINCHPGLIPQSRGLDALKWSLLEHKLIGNTLHFIDEEIDSGKIIQHQITPILQSDTLETISVRHYNYEINLLINFLYGIKKNRIYKFKNDVSKKRMILQLEKNLLKNFNKIKKIIIKKQ
jgi:phosphoribosylglycinamide formyltransferase-1